MRERSCEGEKMLGEDESSFALKEDEGESRIGRVCVRACVCVCVRMCLSACMYVRVRGRKIVEIKTRGTSESEKSRKRERGKRR